MPYSDIDLNISKYAISTLRALGCLSFNAAKARAVGGLDRQEPGGHEAKAEQPLGHLQLVQLRFTASKAGSLEKLGS